ncbi:MAG: hypothetical protein V4717_09935 [Bacteroidota bacterium]
MIYLIFNFGQDEIASLQISGHFVLNKGKTILLLLLVLVQIFGTCLTKADYLLNKNFIATVLCINKQNTAMQCHGKCYLSKQIKKLAGEDEQTQNTSQIKMQFSAYYIPLLFTFPVLFSLQEDLFPTHLIAYQSPAITSVFHPPSF